MPRASWSGFLRLSLGWGLLSQARFDAYMTNRQRNVNSSAPNEAYDAKTRADFVLRTVKKIWPGHGVRWKLAE
jgi:hypothetical protein